VSARPDWLVKGWQADPRGLTFAEYERERLAHWDVYPPREGPMTTGLDEALAINTAVAINLPDAKVESLRLRTAQTIENRFGGILTAMWDDDTDHDERVAIADALVRELGGAIEAAIDERFTAMLVAWERDNLEVADDDADAADTDQDGG
jgi:hypothetical protein